jgi:hypothetical protein
MSFEDLWDQLDLVIRHSELRREGVEDLRELLKLRAEVEVKCCKGLDRLAQSEKSVSRNGSLADAVTALKTHWFNRAAKSRAMAEMILSDLLLPLGAVVTKQSPLAKIHRERGKEAGKDAAG